ncbi:MAG TPA: hypothetical protein VE604_11085 [Candidatus Polarisedimenticolia bacterium]|nr:hypothetical protein [Candidatus Polarisedimenticolia bacterium]
MLKKVALTLTAILVVVVTGIAALYWRSNTIPGRPNNVSPSAVFLWAPYVGLPAARRGWWMSCEHQPPQPARCALSDIDGTLKYEGEFLPYVAGVAVGKLDIDAEKTREYKIWVGDALVPIVYLKNGEILIPSSRYEEGKRILDLKHKPDTL